MTAYYGFTLFAVCIGGILFGLGMGFNFGLGVGEKRGQQAAEFAYSYGLLNKGGVSIGHDIAAIKTLQLQLAAQAQQYSGPGHGVTHTVTAPSPYPYGYGGGYAGGQNASAIGTLLGTQVGTGGAGGHAQQAVGANPLTNYGNAYNNALSGVSSKV